MEEILGRHLLPDETVHHRNGVRNDNRPENLELWVRPQPTGIRVVDAVAWAREILERYEVATSNNAQRTASERSWRWGDSNPRPQVTVWVFYGRSLRSGLASRLPQAEDLSASPASLSDGGHRAELPS